MIQMRMKLIKQAIKMLKQNTHKLAEETHKVVKTRKPRAKKPRDLYNDKFDNNIMKQAPIKVY